MINSIYESALQYREKGIEVIPLKPGEKLPACKFGFVEYGLKSYTDQEIKNLFLEQNNNIGILFGLPSNGLVNLDFDSKTALKKWLPKLGKIANNTMSYNTNRGGQICLRFTKSFYQNPYAIDKKQLEDKIDIKYYGYSVAPISVVGDFQYQFENFNDCNIYEIEDVRELPFPIKKEFQNNIDLIYDYEFWQAKKETYLNRNNQNALYKPYGLGIDLFNVLKADYSNKIQARYATRSEAEQALITELVKQHWTFEQIHELFTRHAVSNTHFKQHKNSYQWLLNGFNKALIYLENNKRQIDIEIDNLVDSANNHKWQGKNKLRDKMIFLEVLKIAHRTGKLENIDLASREIALNVGIHWRTANKALYEHPFLSYQGKNQYGANVYKIDKQKLLKSYKPKQLGVKVCYNFNSKSVFSADINHDLFRNRKGLGKTGYEVYKALYEYEALEVKELIKILEGKVSTDTIFRKLRIMTGYSIAIKQDNKYKLNPAMTRDQAAARLGVLGKGEKQKRQHKADRDNFKKKRKEYAKSIEENKEAIKH